MNKKLFKKQMMTILIALVVMILTGIITKALLTNELRGLFTIKAYKEAFTITDFDRFIIKLFGSFVEIMAMCSCYIELQYNKEIAEIEREEELFMKGVNMEWEKA